ncbi:MAG: 3,5-cyclic-AMP phosphodiesterase [Phycisphaerales bacterium]|nr:3,5-cyclic-AMP phosphodiesterase [Phycisphaerales bacterium]
MKTTRREILRAGIASGASLLATNTLTSAAKPGASAPDLPSSQPETVKPFRVAHLTDMHVQPERRAGDGYLAALESLEKLSPAPDLIVTGGDHVMDVLDAGLDRARTQWDVYHRAMNATKTPVKSVLGNHDIWGWGVKEISDSTVGYGRAMALDQLKLANPYYSFDAGQWHFVMLDSMTRRDFGYTANFGPEQTEWLKGDLAAASRAKKNIILFSHIPILSVCVFFDGLSERIRETEWNVPDSWMHHDAHAMVDLLDEHNVKLAVSGHIHLVDRCDYRNVAFICDGAVSGNWWKGPLAQFPEGYGVIDLYPDGRFEHQYITYGWKASVT